jgi:hypothetical protein
MTEKSTADVKEDVEYQTLAEFLEGNSPNQLVAISDLSQVKESIHNQCAIIKTPQIQLHCNHESCNGTQFFRCISGSEKKNNDKDYEFFYVTYKCTNCQVIEKTFSVAAKVTKKLKPVGERYKFGELPTFGSPVSPKHIKLIGPDREGFLKDRRCGNQGLGIGAFIYYRGSMGHQMNLNFC